MRFGKEIFLSGYLGHASLWGICKMSFSILEQLALEFSFQKKKHFIHLFEDIQLPRICNSDSPETGLLKNHRDKRMHFLDLYLKDTMQK